MNYLLNKILSFFSHKYHSQINKYKSTLADFIIENKNINEVIDHVLVYNCNISKILQIRQSYNELLPMFAFLIDRLNCIEAEIMYIKSQSLNYNYTKIQLIMIHDTIDNYTNFITGNLC